MKFFSTLFLAATASALHYEKPPCGSDEKAVSVMGVDGSFCAPMCSPSCPTDTPEGVSAVPSCALQAPTGEKFCAILCQPMGGGECGPEMECAVVPQSGGLGLCTYPESLSMLRSGDASIKSKISMEFVGSEPVEASAIA